MITTIDVQGDIFVRFSNQKVYDKWDSKHMWSLERWVLKKDRSKLVVDLPVPTVAKDTQEAYPLLSAGDFEKLQILNPSQPSYKDTEDTLLTLKLMSLGIPFNEAIQWRLELDWEDALKAYVSEVNKESPQVRLKLEDMNSNRVPVVAPPSRRTFAGPDSWEARRGAVHGDSSSEDDWDDE